MLIDRCRGWSRCGSCCISVSSVSPRGDDFGKIAELLRLEKDLAAGIRADSVNSVCPAIFLRRFGNLLRQTAAVENAALAGLAFDEREPFLEKLFGGRLFAYKPRNCSPSCAGVRCTRTGRFLPCASLVVKVGERDHGAPAHAARDDNIADLAADIMDIDIRKSLALLGEYLRRAKSKE